MDRNVLTPADVVAIRDANATAIARGASGASLRADDAGDRMMGGEAVDAAPGGLKVPSPDSWNQRLLKYIPGEAMGTYLALDRAASTSDALKKNAFALGLVLLASVVFNSVYLRRVWKVRRLSQIITSNIALVAYVYALGGVFATLGWSPPAAQMMVVIVAAAFLIFFEPPEATVTPPRP